MLAIGTPFQRFLLFTQLPASAKCSIDTDQVEGNVTRSDRKLVLLLDLRGFQIENSVEVDGAGAVLPHPKLSGCRGRLDAAFKVLGLFPRSDEAAERSLDFPAGCQDRVLVGRNQLLRLRFLKPHVVLNPAVIQDVPVETGKDSANEASSVEQLGKVGGIPTDDAVDGDGRI